MAYYYDGVKCDTLAELNALRQSRGAQPMVAAHSSKYEPKHGVIDGACSACRASSCYVDPEYR